MPNIVRDMNFLIGGQKINFSQRNAVKWCFFLRNERFKNKEKAIKDLASDKKAAWRLNILMSKSTGFYLELETGKTFAPKNEKN